MHCLFSIYYPHSELPKLMKHHLVPLVEVVRNEWGSEQWNYFLSLYKGENIAVSFYPADGMDGQRLSAYISKKTEDFFNKYPAANTPVQLPLSQLFLNIPANTLHFWNRNPFYQRNIMPDPNMDLLVKSILSNVCRLYFAGLENKGKSDFFNLYLTLLMIFDKILTEMAPAGTSDFASLLLARIKELKKEDSARIISFEESVRESFKVGRIGIEKVIDAIRYQIDRRAPIDTTLFISAMRDILEKVETNNILFAGMEMAAFYLDIFIILTQKISLSMDALIRAAIALEIRSEGNRPDS